MNFSKSKFFKFSLVIGLYTVSVSSKADITSCLDRLPNTRVEAPLKNTASEFAELNLDGYKGAVDQLRNSLLDTSNGVSSVGNVLDNFINDLDLSTLLIGGDDDESGEPITLTHNLSLFGDSTSNSDHNAKIQLRIFRDPQVFGDLAELLGEDVTGQLQAQIDELDDVEVSFSLTRTNQSTGRLFNNYREDFNRLARQYFDSEYFDKATDQRDVARAALIDALFDAGLNDCATPFVPNSRSSAALRKAYSDAKDTQAIIAHGYLAFSKRYKPTKYAALVSNQPQLIFTGSHRQRSEFVGADETSVKVSYEMGLYNINGLRKFQERNRNEFPNYFDAYAEYVARKNPILRDDRFAVSLEYSDVGDFAFDDGTNQLSNVGGEKLSFSLAYGRTLRVRDDKAITRFDAGIEAIEFLGDTEGVDRIVASATLTYRVAENVSIPITIEYANRSEFLSDDSSTLGANIGFSYDFNLGNSN